VKRLSIRERFELHTIPEPNSGCLLWIADVSNGYGRMAVNRRKMQCHRVAWAEAHGPIPDGMDVLHSCDNPPCVNVNHLFLGTNADNMADCVKKGRSRRGERHRCVKLTRANVLAIRESSDTRRVLAERYGVRVQTIAVIIQRKSWSWL